MEKSQAPERIIDLGRSIVKELELDSRGNTLSKWMAYYLAEKIEMIDTLNDDEKNTAEKECFEIILRLWKERWSAKHGKGFLNEFEPLFKTLEKLNPNRDRFFFMRERPLFESDEKASKAGKPKDKSLFKDALKVDKLARSIIYGLLTKATSDIQLSTEKKELIENAIDLVDEPEIKIISTFMLPENDNEDDKARKQKEEIKELKQRISALEAFSSIKDSLLQHYMEKLARIEK